MDLDLDLLTSIASGGLGCWRQDPRQGRAVYVKSDDCVACLRDLQRFLRSDDPEERPAFFAVHAKRLARTDLVPLVVTYPEQYDVVYNTLKVATFLTMPSEVGELTKNRAQQAQHVQEVREAFLARDALAAVVGLLAEPLSRHPRMGEADTALVQLVITFLRNLVAVPTDAAVVGGDTGARVRSALLERLFADNALELLLLLAQHAQQRPFRNEAPVLVEMFMHLLTGLDPEELLGADAKLAREKEAAEEAAAARSRQKQKQQQGRAKGGGSNGSGGRAATTAHLARLPPVSQGAVPLPMVGRAVGSCAPPSRHAQSGAVYVRRHVDHSRGVVLRHNPGRTELPQLPAAPNAKQAQAQKKDGAAPGPGAAPGALAAGGAPRLGTALLSQLNAYVGRFLGDGCYNMLMGQVLKELEPGLHISRLEPHNFLHFVRLGAWCTRYVRMRQEAKLQEQIQHRKEGQQKKEAAPQTVEEEDDSPFSAVSATMGWDCFYWLTMMWILLTGSERAQADHLEKNWALQHASVPLLKEMLLTLDLARVAGNAADRRAADRLQRRLLHDDLKESGLLPVLARLMRGYNYRFQPRSHAVELVGALHVVLGMLDRLSTEEAGGFRVRTNARGGGGGRRKQQAQGTPGSPKQQQQAAEEEEGESGGGRAGAEATAEAGQQEQQEGEGEAAPGEQGAGAAEGAAEAAGGSPAGSGAAAPAAGTGAEEAKARVGRAGDPLEEEEEEQRGPRSQEVDFQTLKRLRQECAQPAIVHFYTWLLQGYRTNCAFTNHALVSLLRRVASPSQLNLEPMLWQLSVLRLFQAVMSDPVARKSPAHAELLGLATRTTRNLLARLVPDLSEARSRADGFGGNLSAQLAAAGGGADKAAEGAAAAAADGDDEGASPGGEAVASAEDAEQERRLAKAEVKAREQGAAMLFVDLLFWKGAPVADDLRQEYNWKAVVAPEEKKRGGRRGRRASGGGSDSDVGRQLGFASYRKKPAFTEGQEEQLRAAFERCNGRKDCLEELVFEFGGAFKKSQISKQLKAMLLTRGKLTARQEERVRELHEEHKSGVDCFERIAEELAAGFNANQVKRHLRTMGVLPSKARRRKQDAAWQEMLGSDGEEGAGAQPSQSMGGGGGGARAAAAGLGSGDDSGSDSGSESDGGASGFESPKSDLECRGAGGGLPGADSSDSDSEEEEEGGMGGGKRAARRLAALQALRHKAATKQGRREASPELGGGGPEAGAGEGAAAAALGSIEFGSFGAGSEAPSEEEEEARQPGRKQQRLAAPAGGADGGFPDKGGAASSGEEGGGGAKRRRVSRASAGGSNKRKPEAELPAGPGSAQKRAALEALRRRRQAPAADTQALLPSTEPFGEWQEEEWGAGGGGANRGSAAAAAEGDENVPHTSQQQQQQEEGGAGQAGGGRLGRRLLKKGAGGGGARPAAVVPAFDASLDDF